jgi:transposase
MILSYEMDIIKLPRRRDEIIQLFKNLEFRIKALEEENKLLKRQIFGRKSEKYIDESQGELFESASLIRIPVGPSEEIPVAGHSRHKKRQRLINIEGMDVTERVYDIPDAEKLCGCGAMMTRIGAETSLKVEYEPEKVTIEKQIRPKYGCKKCEGSGDEDRPAIRIAKVPPQLIPKSMASASLLAFILVMKLEYGMPFYRLSKKFKREGIEISRADMSNWMVRVGKRFDVLEKLLWGEIKEGPGILIDETPFQVFRVPGRENTSKSQIWAFRGGTTVHPVVIYRFHPTRSGNVPLELLKGYRGYIQTDGYSGYNILELQDGIIHVGDWTHVRRKFVEAEKASPGAGNARHAISLINKLFQLEKRLRLEYLDPVSFLRERKARVLPIFDELKAWLMDLMEKVPPSVTLGKAMAYTVKEWDKLVRYVDCVVLTPSTNLIENAIRTVVIGRKNFLFSGSPDGAQSLTAIYSLIETAKANGLEPFRYLRFLCEELPLANTDEELNRLLPMSCNQAELKKRFRNRGVVL